LVFPLSRIFKISDFWNLETDILPGIVIESTVQSCNPVSRAPPDTGAHGTKHGEEISGRNVSAIIGMEMEAVTSRSLAERFADKVAHHAERVWSVALHAVRFGGWIVLNCGTIPGLPQFDPYPFQPAGRLGVAPGSSNQSARGTGIHQSSADAAKPLRMAQTACGQRPRDRKPKSHY
jgi:hypothetical protein